MSTAVAIFMCEGIIIFAFLALIPRLSRQAELSRGQFVNPPVGEVTQQNGGRKKQLDEL